MVAKSSVQLNWVTYAVSLYLAKDYSRALEVLASFQKTMKEDGEKGEKLKKHDKSELAMFEARIHEAMGNAAKALDIIKRDGLVVNRVAKHEIMARLFETLGEKDKAIDQLEELLQLNSSNLRYYYDILRLFGYSGSTFTPEQQTKIEQIISVYEKNLPKSTAHQRILLKLLSGDRFKERLWAYARPYIIKGAPALIIDLKADVYGDAEKTQQLEELLLSNVKSMEDGMTLVGESEE